MNYGVILSFAGALEDRELDMKSHADCWDLFSRCRFNGLASAKVRIFCNIHHTKGLQILGFLYTQ